MYTRGAKNKIIYKEVVFIAKMKILFVGEWNREWNFAREGTEEQKKNAKKRNKCKSNL